MNNIFRVNTNNGLQYITYNFYSFPERNLTTYCLLNISGFCLRNETTDPLGMTSLKSHTVIKLLRLNYHKK